MGDDGNLAKMLQWIVGPSNRDHLPNLTLTTTRSEKQYLSVKKTEREIGRNESFIYKVFKVSQAIRAYFSC